MNQKISVIMTVYNMENYIKNAIESILDQTYKNYEFIIINDGSTDDTDKIVSDFQDKRIRYFRLNQNKGIAFCRNLGLSQSNGEYIAIMDSDDIAPPYRLLDQFNYMENHPDVGVLSGDVFYFGSVNKYSKAIQGNEQIQYRFFFRCPINNPAAIVRKSVLDQYNIRYDTRYPVCTDYKFWIDLLNRTRFENLGGKPYAFYRNGHKESITTETSQLETVRNRDKIVFEMAHGFLDRFNLSLTADEYQAICAFRSYEKKELTQRDYDKMAFSLEKLIEEGKTVMPSADLWEDEMQYWLNRWKEKIS